MDASALALRAPILRHVYNEIPEIRTAIDKVATMLSQGLMTVGGGSERVAAFAGTCSTSAPHGPTWLTLPATHSSAGTVTCHSERSQTGLRLLPPEKVTILDSETVQLADGGTDVIHTSVMHMTGAEQQGSLYGLSVLEPFVQLRDERETFQASIEMAKTWSQIPAPEYARAWALGNVPLARRRLKDIDDKITATLGGTTHLEVEPPADLYFPGHELMAPAAAGLSLVTHESGGNAETGEQD